MYKYVCSFSNYSNYFKLPLNLLPVTCVLYAATHSN